MNLFEEKEFIMHSGEKSFFKIECDALTDNDINTLALLIKEKYKFRRVYGVRTGGLRLEEALRPYCNNTGPLLIVDDVLTTGKSMDEARFRFLSTDKLKPTDVLGVVIFARGKCPPWVHPIFQLWRR